MKHFKWILALFISISMITTNGYAESSARDFYDKAVNYGKQGYFEKARTEAINALKIDKQYSPAKNLIDVLDDFKKNNIKHETTKIIFQGAYELINGELEKAIKLYKKGIILNPNYAGLYSDLTGAYIRNDEHEMALRAINKAIKLNPKDDSSYVYLGNIYQGKDRYDSAIVSYNEAIEINPKNHVAWYNRGLAYSNLSKPYEAIDNYTKAISINPMYTPAYVSRGYVYYRVIDNDEKACVDYSKACELGQCRRLQLAVRTQNCKMTPTLSEFENRPITSSEYHKIPKGSPFTYNKKHRLFGHMHYKGETSIRIYYQIKNDNTLLLFPDKNSLKQLPYLIYSDGRGQPYELIVRDAEGILDGIYDDVTPFIDTSIPSTKSVIAMLAKQGQTKRTEDGETIIYGNASVVIDNFYGGSECGNPFFLVRVKKVVDIEQTVTFTPDKSIGGCL